MTNTNTEWEKVGRWAINKQMRKPAKSGKTMYFCRCDCGTERYVLDYNLKDGVSTSCGCLGVENRLKGSTTHGLTGVRTYRIWKGMRQRCQNPKANSYERYGGRGITVCKRWQKFENFLADMGNAPEGKSLDRINTNGGYSPNNCRWATPLEQTRNSRPTPNNTGVRGIHFKTEENRFYASITTLGLRRHLGVFKSLRAAKIARKEAERIYWLSPTNTV